MLRLLQSETEILIKAGFIYLPLMFDPSIEEEIETSRRGPPASGTARVLESIEGGGKYFLKSLHIDSLLENYRKLDPQTYERIRLGVLERFFASVNPVSDEADEKLEKILFRIIPHFARRKNGLRKRTGALEEFLESALRQADIPARFFAEAERLIPRASNGRKGDGGGIGAPPAGEPKGLITAKVFRLWLLRALEAKIVREEKKHPGTLFAGGSPASDSGKKGAALLLFLKETGFFEMRGAGFFRDRKTSEYYVYVRTGQYALKDYQGRIYLFPDCRVAVPARGPTVPYVAEKYKHPFLWGNAPFQKICVTEEFVPDWKFSASGAIRALEEGIDALFHGYNARRGNGYHRLDGMRIDRNSIVFDDLRIPRDDPRIVSGELEVKNDFY